MIPGYASSLYLAIALCANHPVIHAVNARLRARGNRYESRHWQQSSLPFGRPFTPAPCSTVLANTHAIDAHSRGDGWSEHLLQEAGLLLLSAEVALVPGIGLCNVDPWKCAHVDGLKHVHRITIDLNALRVKG